MDHAIASAVPGTALASPEACPTERLAGIEIIYLCRSYYAMEIFFEQT